MWPGWSPTSCCSHLPSLYLSLAPSLFPVTKNVFLCLSQKSPACPHVPWFLAFCLSSVLKNSFSPNKISKIAPSHHRWAGYPLNPRHPCLCLTSAAYQEGRDTPGQGNGIQNTSNLCPEYDSVDSPAGCFRSPFLSSEALPP